MPSYIDSPKNAPLVSRLALKELKYCYVFSAIAAVVMEISARVLGPSSLLPGILLGSIVVGVALIAIRDLDAAEESKRIKQVGIPIEPVSRSFIDTRPKIPRPWYPNGHGSPRSPTLDLTLHSHTRTVAYGFRE